MKISVLFSDKIKKRLGRRLPSFSGFMELWKPTSCLMCYWWRLCFVGIIVLLINYFNSLAAIIFVSLLFFIGGYFGIRSADNEI